MNEQEARTVEAIRSSWDCKTSSAAEDIHSLLTIIDSLSASKPPKADTIEVDGVVYGENMIRELRILVDQCRSAGFIDDTGTIRKVLGTLPLTADGYLAGSDAELWWVDNSKYVQMVCVLPTDVSDCYSTRSAAEAAREAKP